MLVRGAGLEPARSCERQDLNLVRLPISPPARFQFFQVMNTEGGPEAAFAFEKQPAGKADRLKSVNRVF